MKIGEIIAKIGELIAAVETNSENVKAPETQIQNPADLTPVVIAANSSDDKPSPNGQTASGNDKEPQDIFLPPLQQKQELLKKAVGVDNIYDDGQPGEQQEGNDEEMVAAQQDIVDRIKRLSGIPVAAVQELSNDDIVDD